MKFGVYDTDWSTAGGWRLLKTFDSFAEELGVTFSNICYIWRKHGLKGGLHFARTS